MRMILMMARHAFDHKEWLKERGFKWNSPYWEKPTSSKEEWQEVQAYSRGRFKLEYRDPAITVAEMSEPTAKQILAKNRRHLEEAKAAAVTAKPEGRPTRDQFYIPGYSESVGPKPYAHFGRPPFTGHSTGGPRGFLADDDTTGRSLYFSRRKKR